MQSCHQRIVDIWLPDKAVSIYVIGGCFKVLAREWNDIIERNKDNIYGLRHVAMVACVIILLDIMQDY